MPSTDKAAQLHDRLVNQIEALIDGQDWKEFLGLASRFHRYSTGGSGISELRECPAIQSPQTLYAWVSPDPPTGLTLSG